MTFYRHHTGYFSVSPVIKYHFQAFVVLSKKKSLAKDFPFHLALTSAGLDLLPWRGDHFLPSNLVNNLGGRGGVGWGEVWLVKVHRDS